MVKISVFYSNDNTSRFDMDYYLNSHIPRCVELFSAKPGYLGVSVEKGINAGAPGTDAPYLAMAHFLFSSVEEFQATFAANAAALQADVANYTDISPALQISEVLLSA